MSLREKIVKYFKPIKVYDVSKLAEKEEITDEIEKALWELRDTMGLTESEIESAVSSLNKKNK